MTMLTSLTLQAYRAPVVGTGTEADPYRPLLPVALQPGEGWAAHSAFAATGTVDLNLAAETATHEALAAEPMMTQLAPSEVSG